MVPPDINTPPGCPVVAVVGPTAVGKTALALWLAQSIPAEIISADSVQIYRYLNIGSSKVTDTERLRVPHHLIDIVDPDEHFDAGRFVGVADSAASLITASGRLPLVVGGTGLWLRAFFHGLADSPEVSEAVKESVHRRYRDEGLAVLYRYLCVIDPPMGQRLPSTDTQRILRAVEVFEATGQRLSDLQNQHGFQQERYRCLRIGLRINRSELYDRINRRVVEMVEGGLIEEVQGLLDRGFSPHTRGLNTPGYRETIDYLNGSIDKISLVARIQQSHRRYAKRQLTWFASDPQIIWFEPDNRQAILQRISEFLVHVGWNGGDR